MIHVPGTCTFNKQQTTTEEHVQGQCNLIGTVSCFSLRERDGGEGVILQHLTFSEELTLTRAQLCLAKVRYSPFHQWKKE